jgi:hypothetical protein
VKWIPGFSEILRPDYRATVGVRERAEEHNIRALALAASDGFREFSIRTITASHS